MAQIHRLNHELGRTVELVTQEPSIAAYAERTVTFRDGLIISDERKAEGQPTASAIETPAAAIAAAGAPGVSAADAPPPAQETWTVAPQSIKARPPGLQRHKMRAARTVRGIFTVVAAAV